MGAGGVLSDRQYHGFHRGWGWVHGGYRADDGGYLVAIGGFRWGRFWRVLVCFHRAGWILRDFFVFSAFLPVRSGADSVCGGRRKVHPGGACVMRLGRALDKTQGLRSAEAGFLKPTRAMGNLARCC